MLFKHPTAWKVVFYHPAAGQDLEVSLCSIWQWKHSVAEFTEEFSILAAGSEWSEPALLDRYQHGLRADLHWLSVPLLSPSPSPELMQLRRAPLSWEKCQGHVQEQPSLHYGEAGQQHQWLPSSIPWNVICLLSVSYRAGMAGSFIDTCLAQKLSLPRSAHTSFGCLANHTANRSLPPAARSQHEETIASRSIYCSTVPRHYPVITRKPPLVGTLLLLHLLMSVWSVCDVCSSKLCTQYCPGDGGFLRLYLYYFCSWFNSTYQGPVDMF